MKSIAILDGFISTSLMPNSCSTGYSVGMPTEDAVMVGSLFRFVVLLWRMSNSWGGRGCCATRIARRTADPTNTSRDSNRLEPSALGQNDGRNPV